MIISLHFLVGRYITIDALRLTLLGTRQSADDEQTTKACCTHAMQSNFTKCTEQRVNAYQGGSGNSLIMFMTCSYCLRAVIRRSEEQSLCSGQIYGTDTPLDCVETPLVPPGNISLSTH